MNFLSPEFKIENKFQITGAVPLVWWWKQWSLIFEFWRVPGKNMIELSGWKSEVCTGHMKVTNYWKPEVKKMYSPDKAQLNTTLDGNKIMHMSLYQEFCDHLFWLRYIILIQDTYLSLLAIHYQSTDQQNGWKEWLDGNSSNQDWYCNRIDSAITR